MARRARSIAIDASLLSARSRSSCPFFTSSARIASRASRTARVSAAFSFQETLRVTLHGVFEARIDGSAKPLERAPPECLGAFVIFGLRDRNVARVLVLAVRTLFTGPALFAFVRRL